MVRIFASDLDGTLLDRSFRISEANRTAVRMLEKSGICFAVATGRIYYDAVMICRDHGLSPYIIASNGATVFDKEGNQIYGRWIPGLDLEEIVRYLEREGVCYGIGTNEKYIAPSGWEAMLDQEAHRLLRQGKEVAEERMNFTKYEMTAQNGFEVMDIKKEIRQGRLNCYSVSVVTHDGEAVGQLVEFIKRFDKLTVTVSGSHNVEIMSKDGTKGNALRYLAEMFKIRPREIAAIGDSFNDLSMLKYAGVSIAMGNAAKEIKACCSWCTKPCAEDGFAVAVENLLSM